MKFTFSDKKVNLPKSLHSYAEKKVGKLDRYFKNEAEASLVFSVEKNRNKVELTIRSGSTILRVAESTSDMFASVDAAVTSMERQGAFVQPEPVEETSFVPDEEEGEFQVVRSKKFPIKPMTVDEAILQMNLLGHSFYAFKDEDGGAFAVVYKRNDGGYGLIEDEG